MNRIATDLLILASELLPRVKATFIRTPKTEEKDLTLAFLELQRFIVTIHNNEEVTTFIGRTDTEDAMIVDVGFSDHEALQSISVHISDMAKKIGKKLNITVDVKIE